MKLDGNILFSLHRYCGYCPQFKYKIKETFGKTTHALLAAPGISRSGRPVLAPLEGLKEEIVKDETRKQKLIESRGKNLGDQKYGKQMVPGYTGVPYECLSLSNLYLIIIFKDTKYYVNKYYSQINRSLAYLGLLIKFLFMQPFCTIVIHLCFKKKSLQTWTYFIYKEEREKEDLLLWIELSKVLNHQSNMSHNTTNVSWNILLSKVSPEWLFR